MFISLEGPDCCGKGTQAKLLAERLDAKLFKFPDKNTPIGALIYDHLFNRFSAVSALQANAADDPAEQSDILARGLADPMMFQCMHIANRVEHAQDIMETRLAGQDVIADRYTASGIVYGGEDGLDREYIHKIQYWLPQPDLNLLLDIDISTVVSRMRDRGDTPDRYEKEETLKGIINGYRQLWDKMRTEEGDDKWVVIDGSKPKVEVAASIIEVVKKLHVRMSA